MSRPMVATISVKSAFEGMAVVFQMPPLAARRVSSLNQVTRSKGRLYDVATVHESPVNPDARMALGH